MRADSRCTPETTQTSLVGDTRIFDEPNGDAAAPREPQQSNVRTVRLGMTARTALVGSGRDVGLGDVGNLAERHAPFAALGEQITRGVNEPRSRPQAGLAPLVGS